MASIYDLKPAFQCLIDPLVESAIRHGVSANLLTAAGLVAAALCGAALWGSTRLEWLLLTVPVLLLARMALNAADGMVARRTGTASAGGTVFNEVSDVVGDWMAYLPLAALDPAATWWVVGFVLAATLTELVGMAGAMAGGIRSYRGPMGKSDRALAVSAIAVAWFLAPGEWLVWALAAATVLGVVTAANRARQVAAAEPEP